jgi:uncharacterized protein YaaW (UPF0174 family)
MKQFNLFGEEQENKIDEKYTSKIKAPIYEPKNIKPHPLELFDNSKTIRLINEINNSNISDLDKKFMIAAAQRHIVFNYSKIADYYAHSSKEVQQLMEHSALVIIDFDRAIEYGYVKLNDEITQQYLSEYENE